jgi:hypothetical protein
MVLGVRVASDYGSSQSFLRIAWLCVPCLTLAVAWNCLIQRMFVFWGLQGCLRLFHDPSKAGIRMLRNLCSEQFVQLKEA